MQKLITTIVMAIMIPLNGILNLKAQYGNFHAVKARIDFSSHLQNWDGFGVNYVQMAHAKEIKPGMQEYGGFSILSEEDKKLVLDMIFGEEGLKPGIVKLFLDPLHKQTPESEYNHSITTSYMLEFAKKGMEVSANRGAQLSFITTLYCPPGFYTLQNHIRGRDLDPSKKYEVARYMMDWVKYLKDREGIPVKYLSLHNEGEDWRRWPNDGKYNNFDFGPDYNMFWPPNQVVDFLSFMRPMMDSAGLKNVLLTPGETSNWYRFYYWGYASAIAESPNALAHLGLITSHSFYSGTHGRYFSGTGNPGTALLQSVKPELHAWITSMSWGKMNTSFINTIFDQIYLARVNAIIPWAVIQRPGQWIGGDPNPGTAFNVSSGGKLSIEPGYYFYKQVSRAGQPGMAVAETNVMDSEISIMAFSSNNTPHPDAWVLINTGITTTQRADALDIQWRTSPNEKINLHFCLTDPTGNKERNPEVSFAISQRMDGYIAELAIPVKTIGEFNIAEGLPFNIILRDGENSEEGKRFWNHDGVICTSPEKKNGDRLILEKTEPLVIDGIEDKNWGKTSFTSIHQSDFPSTSNDFYGKFKILRDNNFIYLWVDINDPTNKQERKVSVSLKGTPFNKFQAFRTSESGDRYKSLGEYKVVNGMLEYDSPPRSVTTFFGIK